MVEITDDNYRVSLNLSGDDCLVWLFLKDGTIEITGCAYCNRIAESGFIISLLGNYKPKETDDDLVKRTTDAAMQDLRRTVDGINETRRLTNLASAHLKPNNTTRSDANERVQWVET